MTTPRSTVTPRPAGAWSLVFFMVVAVAAVALLAFWDERRESAAALDDFASEQAALADSTASVLAIRLAGAQRDAQRIAESLDEGRRAPATATAGYESFALGPASAPQPGPSDAGVRLRVPVPGERGERVVDLLVPPAKLLEGAARVERPGEVRLLLRGPGDARLRGTDGSVIESPTIQRALEGEGSSVWIDRADAPALGLKRRRAAAGLGRVDGGPLGRWSLAVVVTAERVRDRDIRASLRLTLGVLVTAGLVLAFGTAALRRQRRGLLLERELALAAQARERDAQLVTANRAATLGTLAMGIAHEVGTPLGVIAGRAEQLLPKLAGDERASRSVRAILDQAERIRGVVRTFLDIVRGGAPALGQAPPAAVLEGALSLVEHRFVAAGVTLDRRVDPDLPAVHGDVPLLQQALVNLLLNACDACARGGRVEISAAREGDRIVFTVLDDGRGITPEEAARALEPFFTTKAPGLGSGLGLAIASEIVKLHRGQLSLEPNPAPRGTRATVSLPLPPQSSPPSSPPPSPPPG